VQVGLRSYWPEPAVLKWMDEQNMRTHFMAETFRDGFGAVLERAVDEALDAADHLYISLDVDVADPAYAPGTGTPEPGGLTSGEVLWAVRRLAAETFMGDVFFLVEAEAVRSVQDDRSGEVIPTGGWCLRHSAGGASRDCPGSRPIPAGARAGHRYAQSAGPNRAVRRTTRPTPPRPALTPRGGTASIGTTDSGGGSGRRLAVFGQRDGDRERGMAVRTFHCNLIAGAGHSVDDSPRPRRANRYGPPRPISGPGVDVLQRPALALACGSANRRRREISTTPHVMHNQDARTLGSRDTADSAPPPPPRHTTAQPPPPELSPGQLTMLKVWLSARKRDGGL
jgi:hypothetical protein